MISDIKSREIRIREGPRSKRAFFILSVYKGHFLQYLIMWVVSGRAMSDESLLARIAEVFIGKKGSIAGYLQN
jgi:hypothetical protein